MLVLICGGVDGPDIKNFFTMGVGESLIGKGKTAQDDEEECRPK